MTAPHDGGEIQPVWPLVHHDGRLRPREEAMLPVDSIAMRYSISVFEGIRVYEQTSGGMSPWLLEQHVERLRNSCRIMGMDDIYCDQVPGVIDELLRANEVDRDCYVRAAASAANAGGIDEPAKPVLTVSVTPSGRKRWLATGAGIHLTVGPWQRPSALMFPSEAKNISAYAAPRLALTEAIRKGYDSCLLLTSEGYVSEGPTATVFLVENRRIVTPRLDDCVLPGVTRAWVLAVARGLGFDSSEEAVTPQRLRAADEVFMAGTGLEFGPVREIDGRALGGWPSCPVTTGLVEAYFGEVRGDTPVTPVTWATAVAVPHDHAD